MKLFYSTILLLIIVCNNTIAQYRPAHEGFNSYDLSGRNLSLFSRTTAGGTGSDYDIKYHRLELRINPDTSIGKYVKGKVTTYFKTKQANFTVLKFDFASTLVCDAVYYQGVQLSASNVVEDVDTLEITIPNIAIAGTLDSVAIYYQGVPPNVPGFSNGTGFVKAIHNTNQNYVYTLSEPYSAYTWWPCKSLIVNDKADSLDLIISNPIGFRAAGNGTLLSEATVAGSVISTWKHRYPISAYQVAIGVANYDVYPATPTLVNIGGTLMPLYNYIFPETNTTAARNTLNKTALMLTTFSSKFGDYPFKNEKYGHYSFGFGGGMEHNTFSGMNPSTYNSTTAWSVIAHELGHQWFGGAVTCGSWSDIWLNESFATYSEIVCAEFAPSVTSGSTGLSTRQAIKNTAISLSNQSRPIYVSDTSSITSIFTPAVYIYERGAMVISMLRTLLGDTKFFQALRNYQTDPAIGYGTALTGDIKRHMEAVSGLDLSVFFSNWIYNTGFASYSGATWNNAGNRITLKLPQTTTSAGALAHFDMPLAIRIRGALTANDTTVIIYDQNGVMNYVVNGVLTSTGSFLIQYDLSFVPTSATFDAYSQVLAKGGNATTSIITKDPGLTVLTTNVLTFSGKKDGVNIKLWWNIDNAYDYTSFKIEKSVDGASFYNIGSINESDFPNRISFSFVDNNVSRGISFYRIRIVQKDGTITYTKTISVNSGTDFFTITPNPARDYIMISNSTLGEVVNIKIFDAAGRAVIKIMKHSFAPNSTLRVPLNKITTGSYFVEMDVPGQNKFTKQIVVIK